MESNSKIKRLAVYIKKNPDDSFSKFALALEFLKTDQLNKARILFEDIQTKDPEYSGLYYHLGKVYEMLGMLRNAKKTYEKGIDVAAEQNETRTVNELKEVLAELNLEMEE